MRRLASAAPMPPAIIRKLVMPADSKAIRFAQQLHATGPDIVAQVKNVANSDYDSTNEKADGLPATRAWMSLITQKNAGLVEEEECAIGDGETHRASHLKTLLVLH